MSETTILPVLCYQMTLMFTIRNKISIMIQGGQGYKNSYHIAYDSVTAWISVLEMVHGVWVGFMCTVVENWLTRIL